MTVFSGTKEKGISGILDGRERRSVNACPIEDTVPQRIS